MDEIKISIFERVKQVDVGRNSSMAEYQKHQRCRSM